MSRQRLRPALSEGASIPCPRCGGHGHIRDTESSALQILRIIQEESMKDSTAAVHVQVPVEVASFLLNEKRTEIAKIELKQRISVIMVPSKSLDTPHYKLDRLKHDDPRLDNLSASYSMAVEMEDPTTVTRRSQERTNKQEPVIKGVLPDAPAPVAVPKPEPVKAAAIPPAPAAPRAVAPAPVEQGFMGWLKGLFGVAAPAPVPVPAADGAKEEKREARGERGERGDRGDSRRGGRGGRRSEGRHAEGRGRDGEQRRDGAPAAEGAEAAQAPRDSRGRGRGGERPERGERAEGREPREAREGREPRETREPRDGREPREAREGREPRENREARQPREARAPRERVDGDNTVSVQVPAESRTDDAVERAPRAERGERGERGEGRRERGERGERGEGRRERGERRPREAAEAVEGTEAIHAVPAQSLLQPGEGNVSDEQVTAGEIRPESDAGEATDGRRERRSRDR
jgi:ribonuclease E